MKEVVFSVDRDCIDPYFEPHTVAVFSTEEKAKSFIESQPDKENFSISEWTVDKVSEETN